VSKFIDELTLSRTIAWNTCWSIWAVGPRTFFRQRPVGVEKIPSEGPFLLLANHTSLFDPAWAAFHIGRPTNFMASTQLFRVPVLGTLCARLGAFPKAKFVKDRDSMATLSRRYELGQPVVLFPEGERTWDGRQLPILPGIARLIKRLNARVVYCRIKTGHLQHPRWASHPRFVPVEMEYDGPYTYAPDISDAALVEEVSRRLTVDPLPAVPPGSWGHKLAHGLPDLLWACPACLAMGVITVHPKNDDAVRCRSCERSWRLDLAGRLHPLGGGAEPMDVPAATDRIAAAYGDPPISDAGLYESDGIILRGERMTIGEIPRGERTPRPVASGTALLTPEHLALLDDGGGEVWRLELHEVQAVSTELANLLQVRLPDRLLQLTPHGQSPLLWNHFLKPWRERASPTAD